MAVNADLGPSGSTYGLADPRLHRKATVTAEERDLALAHLHRYGALDCAAALGLD
ncbi:MAG: hypothetical protein ACOYY2_03925 [Actinomycetota bacterium]